jgi:NDP-sugar pyrophosphorylase family protein
MAGLGSRFSKAGYKTTKPMLPIHEKLRMFELVIANLLHDSISKIIVVAKEEFNIKKDLKELSIAIEKQIDLIEIDYVTDGPASTVELARPFLSEDSPLVIANSDQYLDFDLATFYKALETEEFSGAVLTMDDNDPKWSFAELDSQGHIVKITEKIVVSHHATAGVYGFNKAGLFFSALQNMQMVNERVNGEYYVGPCYNFLPQGIAPVKNISMGPVGKVMFGLGTPEDYEAFLNNRISEIAVRTGLLTLRKKQWS